MLDVSRRSLGPAFVLVLAIAFVSSGCRSSEQEFRAHVERGQVYRQQGKLKEALLEYQNALQLNPKNADVNFEIAQVLSADQKDSEALFYYGEAYRLDPKRLDAGMAEASLLIIASPDEAKALIDEVIGKNPTYAPAYKRRADYLITKQDLDGALAAAQKAAELDPADPFAYLLEGKIYEARMQLAETAHAQAGGPLPDDALYASALAAFDQGIGLAKEQPAPAEREERPLSSLLFERARVLGAWRGHQDEAVTAYRELVEQAENAADKKLALAAVLGALDYAKVSGNEDFQKGLYERLVALDPENVGAWEKLADLVALSGGSAEDVYKQLLQQIPKKGAAYIAYAGFLARTKRIDEATALLKKALHDGIEPAVVLTGLANLYTQLGRLDDVKPIVDRLQKEYPDEPGTAMAVAQRAVVEGRLDDAARVLQELNSKHESEQAQLQLAQIKLYQQNLPAAAQAAERAIALHGGPWAPAERVCAQVRFFQHDWPGTLECLIAVEQSGFKLDAHESVMAAQSYYETGQPADGRHVLQVLFQLYPEPPVEAVVLFASRERERDPSKARTMLEDALKRAPGNAELLAALTDFDVASRKPQDAITRLDAAIAAAGVNVPAALYAARASAHTAAGNAPAAMEDARLAMVHEPARAEFANEFVSLAAATGQLDQAAQELGELRAQGKLPPASQEALARVYMNLGRDNDAAPLYEQILAKPGQLNVAGVKNDLAYLLARTGKDLERALQLAQEAQAQLPQNPEVADTLGFVYFQKGLYDPAVRQFEYAISLAEASNQPTASFHYRRAVALEKAGHRDEAASAYEKALALDPKFPDAPQARSALASIQADESAQR